MPITDLQVALPMPESQRATLSLIDIEHGPKLVLIALPKDVLIPPHTAPYPASAQLLTGRIEVSKVRPGSPCSPGNVWSSTRINPTP